MNNNFPKGFLIFTCLIIIFSAMKFAQQLVVPFLLAIFISFICAPPLNYLNSKRIPPVLSVSIIIIFLISFSLLITYIIGNSINNLGKSLPHYKVKFENQIQSLNEFFSSNGIELNVSLLNQYVDPSTIMQFFANSISAFGNVLTNYFIILLIVAFTLLEISLLSQKVTAILNSKKKIKDFEFIGDKINKYLAIKTIVSAITGLVIFISLSILKIDYAILWGIIAFFFNFIPNIGSILAAIPAVLLSFLQFDISIMLLVVLIYGIVNIVMGNIIEPRYLGKELGLSTLVVFISLIFWGWLLGPVGMILSIPLTIIAKIILENNESTRWVAILLSRKIS